MKKTKQTTKRLALDKSSVRPLDPSALPAVAGGDLGPANVQKT